MQNGTGSAFASFGIQWVAASSERGSDGLPSSWRADPGLYHDVALGADRNGAEAWIYQSVLRSGDCGLPDAFAPEVKWGSSINPHAARRFL
jgi:4-alpha-glucanotransferase